MAGQPQEEIGLDELVRRVTLAAHGMGKKNPNRLLLLNAAAALQSLGEQLEKARRELEAVGDERRIIVLPGGGEHRVN